MGIFNYIKITYLVFCTFCLLAGPRFVTGVAQAESGSPVITGKTEGLYKATLKTQAGEINVIFPDDMSVGDTISGTVITEPSGEDAIETKKNSDELSGYVVEIDFEQKELGEAKIADGKLEGIVIPADLGNKNPRIGVFDDKGNEIQSKDVPVSKKPHPLQYPGPPSPGDFKLPLVAESGSSLVVMGPFDGTFDTTRAKIGGKAAQVLAESPRKAVIQIPDGARGKTTIEILESGVSSSGELRIADRSTGTLEKNLNGIWTTKSGQTRWRITQHGRTVTADSILIPEEDQKRGYRTNVNILRGNIHGNMLTGKIQQYFLIPIEQCMSMCPPECEQWNEIMLILSEDGNALEGQIQEKAINTETCVVIKFGWKPWTMIRQN